MSMANNQEPKVEFTKISFNVPKKLLEEFETIAYLNHYSRVEGFKEAMRIFVGELTPADYENTDDIKNKWRQQLEAMMDVFADERFQNLNVDPNSLIGKTAGPPTKIDKSTLRRNRE